MHWLISRAVRTTAILVALASGVAHAATTLQVAVVASGSSAPYVELADQIATGLADTGTGVRRVELTRLDEIDPVNTDVIVALGLRATEAVAARDTGIPVVSTLIPRAAFERVAERHAGRGELSAVFLDQPVARQLDLIRIALPDKQRVGVIVGPDSAELLGPLSVEAAARGLQLHAAHLRDESQLSSVLQTVLSRSDVLLSLPDALVFNQRTIQSVLFSAYRRQVPVIGFSPAYVRAGALMAVHSTPLQLGQQVVDVVRHLATSRGLPPAQYPQRFRVDINEYVARSLEIRLDSASELESRLRLTRSRP